MSLRTCVYCGAGPGAGTSMILHAEWCNAPKIVPVVYSSNRQAPRCDTHACNCTGPQNGEPVCPCRMRNVKVQDGRYVEVRDLGPVHGGKAAIGGALKDLSAASKGEQSWTPEISRRAAFGCIELLCLKPGVDMTPAVAKNLRAMRGKFVKVEWRKPEDDWPYFRLLEVNERTSTIKLRGMDFPNGAAKHDGDEFWVDWLDVKHIEPVMVRI